MDTILDVVPHGRSLPGDFATVDDVMRTLSELKDSLHSRGYEWSDVSLLILANSKVATSQKNQVESDQNLMTALDQFCGAQGWYPSLIGSTTFSMFFRDLTRVATDISDGVLIVAVISAVLRKIPVAIEISRQQSDRRYAARYALRRGIELHRAAMSDECKVSVGRMQALESSTVLLFSTGSGHIEAQEFIDFKDVYAVGQELLEETDEARIVGGCATNRSSTQFQCLYYSTDVGQKARYSYTYNHAAVLCLLPHARASVFLRHPYRRVQGADKLAIEFDDHEKYADGRYFYIRRINGRPPVEFLADYWDFSTSDLLKMAAQHTAIPAVPKAHLVTIASSLSKYDRHIWPNVPIWLDEINGEIMLRLVRAEADDSNYYLMHFQPEWLVENARDLNAHFKSNFGGGGALLAFLCESRKYVLRENSSNAEAEELVRAEPTDSPVVGIYLNGEYSVGVNESIGYHNYSEIAAIIPYRSIGELPFPIASARRSGEVKIFICHASRDKALVKAIMEQVANEVRGAATWMDEEQLITGDHLTEVISQEIQSESRPFLFALFISQSTLTSTWVRKELGWAIQKERESGRRFILPVLLDDVQHELKSMWGDELADYVNQKLNLRVQDYSDEGIRAVARHLSADVKEWIRRSLPEPRDPKEFATLRFDPS